MASTVMSIGLQGLKGEWVQVEADVRVDKEQCVIIGKNACLCITQLGTGHPQV